MSARAESGVRRSAFKSVEITIVGSGGQNEQAVDHIGLVLGRCIDLAAQGKNATVTLPGLKATVKVSR